MVLLKLKGPGQPQSQSGQDVSSPQSAVPAYTAAATGSRAASPAASVVSVGPPKLKLNASKPPAPSTEQSSAVFGITKKAAAPKSKKRGANDELAPAAKRINSNAGPSRKPSIKIKPPTASTPYGVSGTTPLTAGGVNKFKLGGPRKQSTARVKALTTYNVKREVPKRETGVGYDSEDSDREDDPAIQQGLILRMQPGEDADILRNAIAEGRVGVKEQGGVEVSIKFASNDLRRAVVKVKGRMYAAALVDLPCIVESMKSWDKKGWWKVADVCQMLLVLGQVQSEAQVRDYPLPREVNKETMQFAHGLTPPMHYVRKRRFRKRVSHRQMENVEEEVERLLKEDADWEQQHGKVTHEEWSQAEWERHISQPDELPYDTEQDAEGEYDDGPSGYLDDGYTETPQEEEIDADMLEAQMQAAFAEEAMFAEQGGHNTSDMIFESPSTMIDQASSFVGAEDSIMGDESAAGTPAQTPLHEPMTQDEQSSDEDESDYDEDSPEAVDEDAAERAAEREQQLEEVADLEREIAGVRAKAGNMANQLLKKRELDKLGKLEGDLKMKRVAFGLDDGE
ncbi:hypothetical protein LTR97_001596 [Elasticomyces elasticus]|uniref:TAFII55 protein conserved region domain-containing protein n=1 Tax=Elasticomyces elasticus TaxID=574655 RepID=A0AAN7WI64_9PEZI|nr:hypothetical protein LTR97_001596 [Elasticomyces elasticus]